MRAGLLALPAALFELSAALHLNPRNASPRVLGLEMQRKHISNPVARDRLRKRQSNTLSAPLDNDQTLYFANVSLGSPRQTLRLDIDTGSSDLWTNTPASQICTSQGDPCGVSGTYDSNNSDSYSYVNSEFFIRYADGTFASGDYATDTLRIGGQDIENLQFGIGYNSTSENGILGIGYEANEVSVATTGRAYRNLPALLVEQNVIQSNAYSLWLNDLDANTGSILFGGVDSEKYHGSLSTLPIVQEQGGYREFIIMLTAMSADGNEIFNSTTNAVPVLLDSGSSLSYLPDDYVQQLYTTYNADYRASQGAAIVDCDLANRNSNVDFTFSSPTISVPLNELVVIAAYQRGVPICVLGISPAGSTTPVLGDTFLRSAYVVYDLENNEISLAQTNFNATGTNVQEIGTGSTAVPDAEGVANAVSTADVASGGARGGGLPTGISGGSGQNAAPAVGATWPALMACGAAALVSVVFGVGLIAV